MTQLTLGMAAKRTGKSKSTITRAIKNGRLSASRRDDSSYLIDLSELSRVWPTTGGATIATPHVDEPHATPDDSLAVMRVRLEAAQAALEREREINNDLSQRLDRSEARVLQLTHIPDHTKEQPKGILERLFGRRR